MATSDLPDYSTGAAWADINCDGLIDLVVSNGNDMERQRVVVYYNNGTSISSFSGWQSDDSDYHGHLSIADVNGDGYPDVAVSVYLGPARFFERGYVKLYMNNNGVLSSLPSWRSRDSMFTFSCSFGDANGDGRPDLAVACGEGYTGRTERNRIYFNKDGVLDSLPGWMSASEGYSLDATWADLDNDGTLDLAFASANGANVVHKGYGDSVGAVPIWTSSDLPSYGNSLFAVDINGDGYPELAVSDNWQLGGSGKFKIYPNSDGTLGSLPFWTSTASGYGSGITLADVTNDGYPDLIVGGWWETVRIYVNQGGSFLHVPQWTSSVICVAEAITLADIGKLKVDTVSHSFFGNGKRKAFVTGPTPLQALLSVKMKDGELPRTQYCYDRESGWVTLGVAPGAGDTIVVTAVISHRLDIAVSNWEPYAGNFIYMNNGTTSLTNNEESVPAEYGLEQNYPNPFNPMTTIAYSLPVRSIVTLNIYNVLGEEVARIVSGEQSAGKHLAKWNATVASGIYFYKLEVRSLIHPADRYTSIRKMVLLR